MRIKIEFSATDQLIPNNQWVVTSYFNDLLGENNEYHGKSGNYHISHLCGGKLTKDKRHLQFNDEHQPFFLVTSNDMAFMSNVLMRLITTKPNLGYGTAFKDVKHINEQFYNGLNHFFVLSPVLLKDKESNKFVNIKSKDDTGAFTINNGEYAEKLKANIINKFSKIDPSLDFKDFDLKIDFKVISNVFNDFILLIKK